MKRKLVYIIPFILGLSFIISSRLLNDSNEILRYSAIGLGSGFLGIGLQNLPIYKKNSNKEIKKYKQRISKNEKLKYIAIRVILILLGLTLFILWKYKADLSIKLIIASLFILQLEIMQSEQNIYRMNNLKYFSTRFTLNLLSIILCVFVALKVNLLIILFISTLLTLELIAIIFHCLRKNIVNC